MRFEPNRAGRHRRVLSPGSRRAAAV